MATERIGILVQVTATHEGCYYVDVPEDATPEQMREILEREAERFKTDPMEVFEDAVGSYSTTYETELGWE